MQLIPISKNILINPELIETIEMRNIRGKKSFVIVIGGQSHIPEVPTEDLLKSLILGGMKLNDQFFSV